MVPIRLKPKAVSGPPSLSDGGTYVRVNDRIIVKTTSPFDTHLTLQTLRVSWTILQSDGLHDGNFDFRVPLGSGYSLSGGVGPGYLQSLYIQVIGGEAFEGQLKVEAAIQVGEILDPTKIHTQLVFGYVSNSFPLSWPKNGYPGDFVSESGQFAGYNSPGPAAMPLIFTPPAGTFNRFHSFVATLVTSAVAGNRFLHVDFKFPGGIMYLSVKSKIAQGPGLTTQYLIGGVDDTPGAAILDGTISLHMDPVIVPPGGTVTIDATNKDAAGDTVNPTFLEELFQV